MIYFDNAATSYHKPEKVYDAVIAAMKTAGNSARGVNEASLSASRILLSVRNKIKNQFNAFSASNVIFTSGATESLNMAIFGLVKDKSNVVTSVLEHNSVLRPLYALSDKQLRVSYVKPQLSGEIRLEDLQELVNENTDVVILTHASNVLGRVNDIEKIGAYLKQRDILFIVDASQTAGLYDIDMQKMNISALCFSAHKYIMGAQGAGVLILNEGVHMKPLKYGGTGTDSYSKNMPTVYPEALEAGTVNLSGIASMGAGLDYIEEYGRQNIKDDTDKLVKKLVDYLASNDRYIIYGTDDYDNRTAVVPFNIIGMDSNKISDMLFSKHQICVRSGAHCAPLCHEFLQTVNSGIVRVSFSHFNTEQEVDILIKALEEIIGE